MRSAADAMGAGTSQNQRLTPALRAGYVLPDELSFASRVKLTLEYAARLRFSAPTQAAASSWRDVLMQDETFVLADVATFPVERLRTQFAREGRQVSWERLVEYFWSVARRVDEWVGALSGIASPSAQVVASLLEREIGQHLAAALHEITAVRHSLAERMRSHPWQAAWCFDATSWRPEGVGALPGQTSTDLQQLRSRVVGAFRVLESLSARATAELQSSLDSGAHEPAMGLLLVVLKLLDQSLEPLNRFPERLIDFYYRDLLRFGASPAAHELAHVLCELGPNVEFAVELPAKTEFLAGEDSTGSDIVFISEAAQRISSLRVEQLSTLRIERDREISPEAELGYATRVHAETIPIRPPDAAYVQCPSWWPLFGGQARGSAARVQEACFGFAIASPLLELREGEREIRLVLSFLRPAMVDPVLKELLLCPVDDRDCGWLSRLFGRYEALQPEPAVLPVGTLERDAAKAWARRGVAGLGGDLYLRYLVVRCLRAESPDKLRHRLGILFAAWLVASDELSEGDHAELKQYAAKLLPKLATQTVEADHPLAYVCGRHPIQRALPFERVFRGLLRASTSCGHGWHSAGVASIFRLQSTTKADAQSGIEVVVHLGLDQPAVESCSEGVHGPGWPLQPVLRLELNSQTRIYGYSLLQALELARIEVQVSARGVQDLVLHNQLGRLDPRRRFQPFGPLPACGDALVLGCKETSQKPLCAFDVNVTWAGLPAGIGGFVEHYAGYPGSWRHEGFVMRASILRDKLWQDAYAEPLRLFESSDGEQQLAAAQTFRLEKEALVRCHRAESTSSEVLFDYDGQRRNGFFRFELLGPQQAFGHRLHGLLMSEALSRNARAGKRKRSLPNPPYTPLIERISIDYRAKRGVDLTTTRPDSKEQCTSVRLMHLHPFGSEELEVGCANRRHALIPRIEHDGNLLIGLAKSQRSEAPQGPLSLLFQLRKETAVDWSNTAHPAVHWARWTEEGWRELDARSVLFDSTRGFLVSGIVTLELPADMKTGAPGLAAGCYWLRVSTHGGFETFAGLYGVFAQAVRVSRVHGSPTDEPEVPIGLHAIVGLVKPVAGLQSVTQIGASFGRRATLTSEGLRIVASERLRHRGRASYPWDYERMLLEAFPAVQRVKCFPNLGLVDVTAESELDDRELGYERAPGRVLVVVVPAPRPGELFQSTESPRLDADTIECMQAYLRARSTPGVQVVVRNATYERVQVRCSVQIARDAHPGAAIRALNEVLVRHLSPWHEEGLLPSFGWEVHVDALEAVIRAQPLVQAVGELSILHLTRSLGGFHSCHDTARAQEVTGRGTYARAAAPFSLALPTAHHLISIKPEPTELPPFPTGIGQLEVGQTFIVSR